MILFFWFPTFICCAAQPQRAPWTPMRPHSHVAISTHLCHSLYDLHCHAPLKRLRSHDHSSNSFASFPCRRLVRLPCHYLHCPFPASQLPGALGLSLERMFYSPQKTAASTMRLHAMFANIVSPSRKSTSLHAKFGCILSLHPIVTLYLYHFLHYHGRLFISHQYSQSYINTSLAYVAIRYGCKVFYSSKVFILEICFTGFLLLF